MIEVFGAFTKSLRDLTRADILWQALWPPLVALVLWGAVAWPSGPMAWP
jgi:hypothetical protein